MHISFFQNKVKYSDFAKNFKSNFEEYSMDKYTSKIMKIIGMDFF